MHDSRGFTLVEVLLAIILLTLGLLALGTSGLFVTATLDRSGRSTVAANFASRRLELLRPAACAPARRVAGSEQLTQGSAVLATNRWWFESGPRGVVLVRVANTHHAGRNRFRTDTLKTAVLCR